MSVKPKDVRLVATKLPVLGLAALLVCGELVVRVARAEASSKNGFASIVFAGHGSLYDIRGREIRLTASRITQMQNSILAAMTAPVDPEEQVSPLLDQFFVDSALGGIELTYDESVMAKAALIGKGMEAASVGDLAGYEWRANLLHQAAIAFMKPDFRDLRPEFEQHLSQFDLTQTVDLLFRTPRTAPQYLSLCAAEGVPIPPPWPDAGWVNQGVLDYKYNFLQSGADTEVWTYSVPEVGVCYALPRKTGMEIGLMGLICQSATTGKACFWDNLDSFGNRIRPGPGETVDVSVMQNGLTLIENCTECHRGFNAFNIHPETVLGNIPRAERDPAVRYTPIGQAATMTRRGWENPPASFEPGTGRCSNCHEIAAPTQSYCQSVLRKSYSLTMPRQSSPAMRKNLVLDFGFAAHVRAIEALCSLAP